MQIHELTQPRKSTQVDEGWATDAISSVSGTASKIGNTLAAPKRGIDAVKAAWQQGKVKQQTANLAKKSQATWDRYVQNWEANMEDPDERAKFVARQDGGLYKRQLTAWVQKNLLSGMNLGNLTNRNEILAVIDQLSQPRQMAAMPKGDLAIPGVSEADDTSAGAKSLSPYSKTTYKGINPAAVSTNLGTGRASAAAPDATPPSSPGLTPSEEERLWLKLAQEVGRAQTAAYTGDQETPDQQPQGAPQGDPGPTLQQALGDQAKNIGAIGAVIQQQAATTRVKSTGNAVVDAALRLMGFTVS